jgi:hypothetical protein
MTRTSQPCSSSTPTTLPLDLPTTERCLHTPVSASFLPTRGGYFPPHSLPQPLLLVDHGSPRRRRLERGRPVLALLFTCRRRRLPTHQCCIVFVSSLLYFWAIYFLYLLHVFLCISFRVVWTLYTPLTTFIGGPDFWHLRQESIGPYPNLMHWPRVFTFLVNFFWVAQPLFVVISFSLSHKLNSLYTSNHFYWWPGFLASAPRINGPIS